jgi:hypothetical protein
MDVEVHLEVEQFSKIHLNKFKTTFRYEDIIEEAERHKETISSAVLYLAGDQTSNFRSKNNISECDIRV